MKIYFKHPCGLEFHFQRQPMEMDKFRLLCYMAGAALGVIAFAVFITAVTGR